MAVHYENNEDAAGEKTVEVNVGPTDAPRGQRKFQARYKQRLLILGSLLVVLLILIVIWMIVVLIKYESPNVNYIIQTLPESTSTTMTSSRTNASFERSSATNMPLSEITSEEVDHGALTVYPPRPIEDHKFKVVSRTQWLAQPPTEAARPLSLPVHYVIISHTATENCIDQSSCIFHTRFIQIFHIESRNWFDIGYNFLVGGDGYAYEGRGWKSEGAHTYGYNSKSIGISFIGTFNGFLPPERQIRAAKQLIEKGVELGYIAPDYKVLAAKQVTDTQSPGSKLFENMKTWPHWSEVP